MRHFEGLFSLWSNWGVEEANQRQISNNMRGIGGAKPLKKQSEKIAILWEILI